MTAHDDLATLRDLSERMALALIDLGDADVHDAHAELCDISRRVEAEIARLGQEQEARHICPVCGGEEWTPDYDYTDEGEMRVDRCDKCQWPPPYPVTVQEWRRRTFFSEYLTDLEAVLAQEKARAEAAEAEVARLRDETAESKSGLVTRLTQRAEAAEAEVARLRDGLRDLLLSLAADPYSPIFLEERLRALLADQDGAAKRVYPVKDWLRGTGDMVWCPGCAFGFGEEHVNEATGQWDCPNCGAQSRDGAA